MGLQGERWRLKRIITHSQALLKAIPAPEPPPWDQDIRSELPIRPPPYGSNTLNAQGGWWKRRIFDIDKATYHHTLSDDPWATHRHCIQRDGGRPSTPYTIWITQTGEILLCVSLTEGLWHDHTGNMNTHLSIGLAGTLHLYQPSDAQLNAAVKVAVWAIRNLSMPWIAGMNDITGHMDWIGTECPGWIVNGEDHWKERFFLLLVERLSE